MSFVGSKGQAGVFQRIIGQMPPHSVYVEPFAGSAQIFWRKRAAAMNILNDLNASTSAKLSVAVRNAEFDTGRRAVVENRDALEMLRSIVELCTDDTLIYCDPPYLLQSRRFRRYYSHEMSDAQHVQLLSVLNDLPCFVLLSGYPSKLYSSRLSKWRCITYRTRTRGRSVTECLWCNFPEPVELHDWRFAGQSHRERVTLNRMAARYLSRFERMPERKRGFILNAIEQRQFGRSRPATPLLELRPAATSILAGR